jgi:hypothetical protein
MLGFVDCGFTEIAPEAIFLDLDQLTARKSRVNPR